MKLVVDAQSKTHKVSSTKKKATKLRIMNEMSSEDIFFAESRTPKVASVRKNSNKN